jgi:hypothetical protein
MADWNLTEQFEAAIATAARTEGSSADKIPAQLEFLLNAYHGYKRAYDKVVAERAGYQGQISSLTAERDGYQNAYETIAKDVGHLRSTAAPVTRHRTRQDAGHGKPSIFLVTLPKSGTVYVSHSLSQSLGYDHTATLVTPTFPKNIVWGEMLVDFAKGGMVSASHMQPDAENIRLLKSAGVTRGVLHLRDPRAALQSWIHFIRGKGSLLHALIDHPDYHRLSPAEQTDHMIDHAFRHFADWIDNWCAVLDADKSLEFLMLMHDDLARDEATYFKRILDFHGIKGDVRAVAKSSSTHFRKGDNDDWRQAFTPAQRARVNGLMPAQLWDRFGWQE